MKFIDLFAGLGGFHLAMRRLGHTCVFACEIDPTLRALYEQNFRLPVAGDIRAVTAQDIPSHDILCAGFPCQPFSKAGSQNGFDDPTSGDLLYEILRLIRYHRPPYLILENVPNFERHNHGRTWGTAERLLRTEGYDVRSTKLSPHHFGIPQIRERIYIVASRHSLDLFKWPQPDQTVPPSSIRDVLDHNPPDARKIPQHVAECLEVWQELLDWLPRDEKVPHPLWAMEFGATYPYEERTPFATPLRTLWRYTGSLGYQLTGRTREDVFDLLPSHARSQQQRFPKWKVGFIRKNREFYARHRNWLDEWKMKIARFPSSFQKLEWNCQQDYPRRIDRCVIQIRASGVRLKRPTTSPSLVAMTSTQVPIIGWERRYITPTECKRLQSMEDLPNLPDRPSKAYEALGNAVNVTVAELVGRALFEAPEQQRSLFAAVPSLHEEEPVVESTTVESAAPRGDRLACLKGAP
ncbi:DNA cytosine methyltransferase [Limnochorda pilosa]|uniref:Cytosine-specific methyltransferase n=1 Tax=Limnochorda pilosa TaxID=1555112 RepID=A0A0K2SHM8_LIMPI|nr:DNA (cytosine-5-)-methyltransferase [Limnochorda pilosa]BAS26334.1 DNA methyltransferase [Limnochorda pilosa]